MGSRGKAKDPGMVRGAEAAHSKGAAGSSKNRKKSFTFSIS